jgi:hypothetical protein
MGHADWLTGSLVYLAAAVLAVPLARFLGLGSILGYLGAGILIGPWGLKLVTRPEDILQVAEFGVVLMLFLVGLELEPQRLWSLRKPIRLGHRAAVPARRCSRSRRSRSASTGASPSSPRSAWRCRRRRSAWASSPSAT